MENKKKEILVKLVEAQANLFVQVSNEVAAAEQGYMTKQQEAMRLASMVLAGAGHDPAKYPNSTLRREPDGSFALVALEV